MTRPSNCNSFHNNLPNSSDNRNGPTCGEQGHMRLECSKERVFCTHCRTPNHDIKACRKYHNSTPSPTNSHIPTGYHPTATPPPLLGTASATGTHPQQTGTNPNRPLFQNYFDTHQPRTSTTIHTPFNGTSPAPSANMTEALTQIITQVPNNKKDNVSKQMMKDIKIFDGTSKAEYITWLSQIEAAARFSNSSFREPVCQSMAPSMLHILSELSALATDQDIKKCDPSQLLRHPQYNREAAARLQGMQISPTEPLVTFNYRYEAIHRVAFGLSPSKQYNKTIIVEYAKKLPQNARDKLLRKITKRDSYIRTLDDTFKQAIEINRETSFVEAAAGKYNDQNCTKIDTQINELDDSFQDCDINAMSTRSTNRSGDRSLNGSFNRSSSRNSSHNSSFNSRPNYRNNNGYPNSNDSHNRQDYNRDNNRNRGYQYNPRYDQRNQIYQNRYDNNQDRKRFDNRRHPNKYQYYRNQPKAQIIFKYTDQNLLEMMQTVRSFINFMKANPTTRDQTNEQYVKSTTMK